MQDFLSRHRAEVKDLFLTEYDEKLHERTLREEGIEQGELKRAKEMAAAMLKGECQKSCVFGSPCFPG